MGPLPDELLKDHDISGLSDSTGSVCLVVSRTVLLHFLAKLREDPYQLINVAAAYGSLGVGLRTQIHAMSYVIKLPYSILVGELKDLHCHFI